MANSLGRAIKEVRVSQGVSQDSLGTALNCDRSMISQYESGKREIPTNKLHIVSDHLKVDSLDLLQLRLNDVISQTIADFKRSR